MVATVDAQSQVEVRYHAVPAGHRDGFALDVMSAVLNGTTGRLYKSMVEGLEIATNASFQVDGKKYAGLISFSATVKGDASPEDLEAAWYEQVALLQSERVSSSELEKVKNNVIADQYRQLQSNFFLMIQLGYMEALGGWEYINYSGDRLLAVSPDDIMRVANTYLTTNNSSVAIYNRSESAGPVDEELARFSPQEQAMIKSALIELESLPLPELNEAKQNMQMQSSQVPPEFKPVFDYLLQKLEEKIQQGSPEPIEEEAVEQEGVVETFVEVKQPEMLVLTPQQLAEANEFLGNLEGKGLADLEQVYAALQGAVFAVPEDERVILEYVLQKLSVYIAEID